MSANNDYKLGRVLPGDNIRSVARASRINALSNLSRSQADGNPYSRSSVPRSLGPGWVVNRKPRQLFRGGFLGLQTPWQIIVITDEDENVFVKCRPGTLNNMIPSNMFDRMEISSAGTWYVILRADTDGYKPTSCFLRTDINPPEQFDIEKNVAPPSFEVLIGLVVSKVVFQMINSLLFATPDNTINSLTDSPAPGRPYYDLNYTWFVDQY